MRDKLLGQSYIKNCTDGRPQDLCFKASIMAYSEVAVKQSDNNNSVAPWIL